MTKLTREQEIAMFASKNKNLASKALFKKFSKSDGTLDRKKINPKAAVRIIDMKKHFNSNEPNGEVQVVAELPPTQNRGSQQQQLGIFNTLEQAQKFTGTKQSGDGETSKGRLMIKEEQSKKKFSDLPENIQDELLDGHFADGKKLLKNPDEWNDMSNRERLNLLFELDSDRNKKNASVGFAFGKMKNVNSKDIPISPPPNAPKCKKCNGHLRFFEDRTECSSCGDVVKDE